MWKHSITPSFHKFDHDLGVFNSNLERLKETYSESCGLRRKAKRCTNSMECSTARMHGDSQNSTPAFHFKSAAQAISKVECIAEILRRKSMKVTKKEEKVTENDVM